MDDRQRMRASDADRQEAIERLRTALDEGRLKMDEYLERMGLASEAVTYGDLAPLYADLPQTGSVAPLVSATTAHLIYPWPLWVAGPWGAVLLAVSVSVTQARHGGQPR